jgi:hypothetical protein
MSRAVRRPVQSTGLARPADEPGPPSTDCAKRPCLLHELTERLTAITNYLEAALRLSQTDAMAAGVSPRHNEILEKAFGQVSQADEAIKQLRRLIDEEAGRAGTRSIGK